MDISVMGLAVGPVQTNCYIVNREGSASCVVIDPGDEAERIAAAIKKKGLENEGILLTHGHFDHITGVSELVSLVGGKVYAYKGERELMMDPRMNGCAMMGYEVVVEPDCLLPDGGVVDIAGMQFQVIHTPGHTAGSCCYYQEEAKLLFSGDTIFMESVGRTDFPTGNGRQLIDSVQNKVLALPADVQIYPGHGPKTSVAYEMANNPYA